MRIKSFTIQPNKALAAILFLYVVLALAYSFADRIPFGPDEPAHFIYVRSLATSLTPPEIAHNETYTVDSNSSHEGHQPPLYYAVMAVPYALMNALGVGQGTIWRILRCVNIALGVIWIYFVYLLSLAFFCGREVKPRPSANNYALVSTSFVALIPTSSYIAAVINNDILTALFFTWAMILILGFYKTGGMSYKSAALLGLLTGLAILTKAQGLILIPMILLAGLLAYRRMHNAGALSIARPLGVALGVAVVVSGWWFARCWAMYGTPMPHSLYNPVVRGGLWTLLFVPTEAAKLTFAMTGSLLNHFWLPCWLVRENLPWTIYTKILLLGSALCLIGLTLRLMRNNDIDRRSLCFLVIAPAAICISWVHYVLAVDRGANLQGRLLLPAAAIIGLLITISSDGLLRHPKVRVFGWAVFGVLMVLVNIFVLWSTVMLRWAQTAT